MAKSCGCGGALGNTGSKSCPLASKTRALILVATEAADGTLNKIPFAQAVDQAYLDARLNEADPTKRWYPITKLENVTNLREPSIFETSAGGKKAKTGTGIKSFFGERWKTPEIYLGKLEQNVCAEMSAFVVDVAYDIRGKIIDTSGDLYPVEIDSDTWDPLYVEPIDTVTGKVSIAFDWSQDECDSEIRMIQNTDITANLKAMDGLFDIQGVVSNITTAGYTLTLNLEYGSVKALIPDTGLLLGDFVVNELSPTPGAVALTSVTEAVAGSGVYDIVFAAPATSADLLETVITKKGRDYTLVRALPVLIP